MKKPLLAASAALALALPASAQEEPEGATSPNQIVETAALDEWVAIPAEDLLVMTLAPATDGSAREVVIQLMPAPFSQGWVENIRTLARAQWYDGISVNRVQDNYVVQWGDPGYDNPESGEVEQKPLPEGLRVMGEDEYAATGLLSIPDPRGRPRFNYTLGAMMMRNAMIAASGGVAIPDEFAEALETGEAPSEMSPKIGDNYGQIATLSLGWPITGTMGSEADKKNRFWPIHCYGMVGVGRNYSPDTGSGAELYTVIGHAPRHLDRNIALVGRIVSGMEHLSSLPRGSGVLGFYTEEEADKRTPILSVRVASDLPESERPGFEYLSTEGETFAKYAEARAYRRDPFFIVPAGGADICNIPVPIRPVAGE
ncbi:peptidylprolyl isomerase [Erythrobacter sp. GH1-10]|uniref:peptidylprolyl isomerase n=1 Tax=Erythrobacter sp. GH1-10 TaxID=3349334 RepID=UPI003877D1D8